MSAMVVGHYPNKRRNALTPAVSVSSAVLDQESWESDPETQLFSSRLGDFHIAFS